MDHKQQLIVFTRFPVCGESKTRLIPHLGAEGAAQLQREMTEYTAAQAFRTGSRVEIRYTGGSLEQMRSWLGDEFNYVEQGEGDLGERMERAFADHFKAGSEQVVVIGADCPSNGGSNMQDAFCALKDHDCVIGPASDGGYYLIGLDRAGSSATLPDEMVGTPATRLFQSIDWGGEQVFDQTMKATAGLSVALLPPLHDVDLPEDIPPRISVIIPTLNEEEHIAQTLEKVHEGFNVEVIVVDGGSTDRTRSIVPDCLECRNGRAAQQNLGAEKASGELLLFLHADTLLPEGWDWVMRETLSGSSVVLGAFSFKLMEQMRGLKFIEAMTNWRSRALKMPYGDQGLFMRKDTFEQAGGFPDMPIMEDYAFVRSLRRLGKIVTVAQPALTSGRRWQQHGVVKVTLINKLMILGYRLGISPEKLASLYRK